MHVEFEIPAGAARDRIFIGWSPIEAKARLRDTLSTSGQTEVSLRNAGAVGKLVFDTVRSDGGADTLTLALANDGSPSSFWVAGQFGDPSETYGDAAIEAVQTADGQTLGTLECMVRVRKNAESLTAAERDRFLVAMGTLNDAGQGRFSDFRDMHTNASTPEAHRNSGFLPWHRAYLLDLERELQAIDDSVALPYWRFDEPAPNLFTTRFIGLPDSLGRVQFTAGHPLFNWSTNGQTGILRRMRFNRTDAPPVVRTQNQTLALGGTPPNGRYGGFLTMEGNPHGQAHVSFQGYISAIHTAARDPLFFMLHCNVDRLWALWQWINQKMSPSTQHAYQQGNRIGHDLDDTMWPWNGIVTPPRPTSAPGGQLAGSPDTVLPGASPRVRDMLDYQNAAGAPWQYFAYDDVPFELDPSNTV